MRGIWTRVQLPLVGKKNGRADTKSTPKCRLTMDSGVGRWRRKATATGKGAGAGACCAGSPRAAAQLEGTARVGGQRTARKAWHCCTAP